MNIPQRIQQAADKLSEGRRVNRITVRDFLRHFGAERRGGTKVQEIRAVLEKLDLATEPDFESAWIDAPILLKLRADPNRPPSSVEELSTDYPSDDAVEEEEVLLEGTPSAVEQAQEQTKSAPTAGDPISTPEETVISKVSGEDPTYRIGRLPAANKRLITVNKNDSLTKAITLMLEYDFSQLPVMQSEREVKGVVTWKSIGLRHAMDVKCATVAECREDAVVVESSQALFDVIPTIIEHGYVLVRDRERRVTGIVTASDLSLQFKTLTEPFLLLREIELHVREVLVGKVTPDDLLLLKSPNPSIREIKLITDLTFGEYVRLIQHPQVWPKLGLKVDPGVLVKLLDEVRTIRNDVVHFDPDPMTPEQLATLKRAVFLLQQLYEITPKLRLSAHKAGSNP
jgi:CBS domain-containing protein